MTAFRTATAGDLEAVVEVFLACWHGAYPGVLAPDVLAAMDAAAARRLWSAALARPAVETDLAESAGRVVGLVRYGRDPEAEGRGHVFSLYVHPDAAGAGIGGALLERARTWFRAAGLAEATLWVFEGNAHARSFYARQGWEPDGAVRFEAESRAPEVRLRTRV